MYDGIGLKSGDEIICPSYTFFATVSPILFTGAIPILVDSDKYGNMDFEKVKEKINDKTKAIVVTHMWGYPCNMEELDKMKDKRNEYAKLVIKELKEITGLTVLEPDKNCENSWYAIILKYNTDQMYGVSRKKFVEAVQKEGALDVDIPESTCPLNKLQLFKAPKTLFENSKFSYENKEFEKSNEFYNTIIKIPVWYDDDDKIIGIKYIRAIKKVCNNIKELL